MKTTLIAEDFGLKPEELKELVEGAQRFLPPTADDEDESVDLKPKPSTS